MNSLRFIAAIAVSMAFIASPAHASDVEAAREHFQKGVELFRAGDHAQALERFLAADAAHHDAAITFNIARAKESLGHAQAAVDAYEAYLAEAGSGGELAAAATLAIAEIKARSTRLRIETTPPGARIRLDGVEHGELTPTSLLVARGKHTVEIEKDDWNERREIDAPGSGSTSAIAFVRSAPPRATPPRAALRAAALPPPQEDRRTSPTRERARPVLDGLMGTFALSISGYSFLGEAEESESQSETSADTTAKGVVFGLAFDVGWALGSRTALVLRGFGGLGSSRSELAALGAGGPALSYRLSDDWWLGGGAIFGGSRAESDATTTEQNSLTSLSTEDRSSSITYRTDFAVGPSVEISYAVAQTSNGQWLASLIPGMLLTTGSEQSTVFIPIVVGYRWF